jgi:vancomycin resistance protein YoaR
MSTETTTPAHPHRGSRLALKFAVAFLVGVVLVAGLGSAGLYAYGQQYQGRVLPGVKVDGTDLSGLTPDKARAAIESASAGYGSGTITLAGPDGPLTVGYAEIGRRVDTEAVLAAALAAGRQGEPVADLIGVPQTALRGVSLRPAVAHDPAALEAAIAAAAKTIDRPPVNATLTIGDDGTYKTTPSVDGRVVDSAALLAAISEAVTRLDAPAELAFDIPFGTNPPAIETADVDAAVAAADRMSADIVLARGKTSFTIPGEALRKLITFAPAGDSVVPVVDEAGIDPLIKPIAKAVNQQAANAGLRWQGSRVIATTKSREGRKLNFAATRQVVLEELMARQSGIAGTADLALAIKSTDPQITTAQAQAWAPKMRALPTGRWTTWFNIYVKNGYGANIWVPARLIDGYVVPPGGKFSFWDAVGEVSYARGFKAGNAIINGRSDPLGAIGGGICSCSTTLFNAALRAGYKMGSRRNHYYYIDRYPVGLDATVFKSGGGSVQDMTWTNDTKYPVLIRGINTRKGSIGYVTFQLYSVPNGRKVTIGSPTIRNRTSAGDTVDYTSSLRPGASLRVEYPVNGLDVWRTVRVYERGRLLREKTYFTRYKAVDGVVLIGRAGAPKSQYVLP